MARLALASWVVGLSVAAGFSVPASAAPAPSQTGPPASLTRQEMAQFLKTARVIRSTRLGKGVTNPWRLTLSDGRLTHDASFQSINERRINREFADGRSEMLFVDSFHYNIAAFRIAELIGLGDMMPVTEERSWNGKEGAFSWWIDDAIDERERLRRGTSPPEPARWNDQMMRQRVFAALVADTDRNLGNVLIGADWKVWMIDFTRAFRLSRTLPYPQDLQRCDHALLAALRGLTEDAVARATDRHLNRREVAALMARRAALVEHFDLLIAQKGEPAVLY